MRAKARPSALSPSQFEFSPVGGTALPIAPAGRFSPLEPLGIGSLQLVRIPNACNIIRRIPNRDRKTLGARLALLPRFKKRRVGLVITSERGVHDLVRRKMGCRQTL